MNTSDEVARGSEPSQIGESQESGKVDIKKLIAVVPPPSVLFAKQKRVVKEKRIRILYDPSVGEEEAKISKTLAEELGISHFLEVSVTGKKRFKFKAVVVDSIPNDVVLVNPEVMMNNGVANNSICTVRSAGG